MHHYLLDHSLLEFHVKKLLLKIRTQHLQPQIQNNYHITEDFFGNFIEGQEISELNTSHKNCTSHALHKSQRAMGHLFLKATA